MVHALGRAHSTCSDSREGDVSGCPGDVGAHTVRWREVERESATGGSAAAGERLQTNVMEVVAGKEGGSLIAGNGRLGVVVADGTESLSHTSCLAVAIKLKSQQTRRKTLVEGGVRDICSSCTKSLLSKPCTLPVRRDLGTGMAPPKAPPAGLPGLPGMPGNGQFPCSPAQHWIERCPATPAKPPSCVCLCLH